MHPEEQADEYVLYNYNDGKISSRYACIIIKLMGNNYLYAGAFYYYKRSLA